MTKGFAGCSKISWPASRALLDMSFVHDDDARSADLEGFLLIVASRRRWSGGSPRADGATTCPQLEGETLASRRAEGLGRAAGPFGCTGEGAGEARRAAAAGPPRQLRGQRALEALELDQPAAGSWTRSFTLVSFWPVPHGRRPKAMFLEHAHVAEESA